MGVAGGSGVDRGGKAQMGWTYPQLPWATPRLPWSTVRHCLKRQMEAMRWENVGGGGCGSGLVFGCGLELSAIPD